MKWVFAGIAAVVLLTAAAIVALPRLVDVPRIQSIVASNASHALGRPVRFASVSVSVFPLPAVTLHKVEIAEDSRFGTTPFLTLESGRMRLRLWPLLRGRIEFTELVLAKPVISVIRDARGRLNVASLGAAPEPRPAPRAPRPSTGGGAAAPAALPASVRIKDGTLVYATQGPATAATRYRIEHLDLSLVRGGPQITFTGTARLTPGDVALKIADGLLTVPASHVLADAPIRANVAIDASDLIPVVAAVAGPVPSVAGALKGMLAVAGTAGTPTASGDVKLSKVVVARTDARCPEPKRRTLAISNVSLNTAWRQGRLTAEPMLAEMPKGAISARLTADVERGIQVRLDDLAVKALPLEAVLVDFLCQGYAVSGPLDLTGALSFAAARPLETLSGPGSLKIGAGKIVGRQALNLISGVVRVGGTVSSLLTADLPASTFASPVEFDAITGTYQLKDGVATTRDLLYTSRAMKVSVAGDYVLASGAMNLDMIINHGRGEVRAKVTGTSAAPAIRIVPSTLLRSVDKEKVESGLRDLLKRFR